MMLSVFETGEASFRLSNRHDEDVGWIRGAALGFDGFATEADALAAAVAGSSALADYLERLTGSAGVGARATGSARGRVHVVHDGAYEWSRAARCRSPDSTVPSATPRSGSAGARSPSSSCSRRTSGRVPP
jgi:hypothetical protein